MTEFVQDGQTGNERGSETIAAEGQARGEISVEPQTQSDVQPSPPVKVGDIMQAITASLEPDASHDLTKKRDDLMRRYLREQCSALPIIQQYNMLILHDDLLMVKADADRIYSGARSFQEKKPLLLVLHSGGGDIGSAYLIGKLCREYSNGKLVVVVPRRAKSAATLICCAADEIHMGSLSELGPIDPQIDQLPALGLKSSIQHIADLVSANPGAAEMFAKYLSYSVQPIHLGYCERVAESAAQYAERLLKSHSDNLSGKPATIANNLVYTYKDHGFVIDHDEAKAIFGPKVVRRNTEEYDLGNLVYDTMEFFSWFADWKARDFYFIGVDPCFMKRRDPN
jgi:hypothetical protein